MKRSIRIERTLPHPVGTVWRALTEAPLLGKWLMENDFEPKLGHRFNFRMKPQRGWDGLTHCEVIALEPKRRVAYTYRGQATGEKPLGCAGVDSTQADRAVKGFFFDLDTVLSFSIAPGSRSDGNETTVLTVEHSGFKGFKMVLVSLIMESGWRRRVLRRLKTVLAELT